LREGTKFG